MCYSLWYNAPTMLPAGRPAKSWVDYITSCNTSLVLLKMGGINAQNMLS